MTDRERYIKTAEEWIGAQRGDARYTEILDWFNRNPYYPKIRADSENCSEFTVACALKTFGTNQHYIPISNTANVQSKKWKELRKEPSVGALAYFDYNDGMGISHVEIVRKLYSNQIWTIDGNAKHKVVAHVHSTHNGYIVGYGTPLWEEEKVDMTDFQKAVIGQITVKKGDRGTLVLWLQKYLQKNGFYKDGLQDGIFGEYMFKETKLWQKSVGLTNDGWYGKNAFEYITRNN